MLRSICFSSSQPFLSQLSRHIIETNQDRLPDLSQINIFIPNTIAAEQLRPYFSRTNNITALLGPYIGNMSRWINNNVPLNDSTDIISQHSRQLLFLDAISQHAELFNTDNNWQVCDALLNLFDELTANNAFDPAVSVDQWNKTLFNAYGSPSIKIHNLKVEANIVYTLWQAWHEQMHAMKIQDEPTAYAARLRSPIELNNNVNFYIIGPEQLSNTEREWCERQSKHYNFEYITQNNPAFTDSSSSDDINKEIPATDIDLVYDTSKPLQERYSEIASIDMLINKISIYPAASYEQEAQAIELQTRLWLLEKRSNIAIISEDRKIARRVRALLDRAGVAIQDTAGWALSTTSASTTIERWLECIEEDFPHQALLDLIKSPFFSSADNRENHLENVYHFEHDIVIHENISRDIKRYKKALINRKHKLRNWPGTRFDNIYELLDNIQQASAELKKLHLSQRPCHPEYYLNALIESLDQLGISPQLEADKAGTGILSELAKMLSSLQLKTPHMTWRDFRTWLAGSLENEQLIINTEKSTVKFMNFKQAQYCTFDAIIIAGANKDKLPGSVEQTAFFNQSVKSSLGLKNWNYKKNYFFYRFKCLLDSAESILITYRNEHNGEWLPASPWVTSLENIMSIRNEAESKQTELARLVKQNSYITDDSHRSEISVSSQPSPDLSDALKPDHYSANHLQKIINCPYQFFASVALSLKAPDHISEELRKSEYGEKIHAILFTFHNQNENTAFKQAVTENNRQQAIHHLTKISEDIFKKDIEDNIQHRSWLKRWLKTIPAYIDWQINWQTDWSIHQLEAEKTSPLTEQIIFKGRLDRIDNKNDTFSIIDYKTGTPPSKTQVISGEDIQLLSYASLIDHTNSIVYLKLDQGEAKSATKVDDETLEGLKSKNRQRIVNIAREIQANAALNAWGDTKTCDHCDVQGLCRKQIWDNA